MAGQISYVDGVKFPSSQVASTDVNTFDDYEEGIWEAAFAVGSGSVTISASYKIGNYTKIGRMVAISGLFIVDSVSSPSGSFTITGLPFANNNSNYAFRTAMSIYAHNLINTMSQPLFCGIEKGESVLAIKGFAAGVLTEQGANVQATSEFWVGGCYFT